MSRNLAAQYRPQTFDEILGQGITVAILKKVIEKKAFKNAYLFAGLSGCGKTSAARCFAKAINNGVGDPIELDCASQNSVENIRALVEAANQRSLNGEYKIYILDECHALSSTAWQVFLKCLEECPKYTIFIFCTTNPSKIPPQVLNRMQRYNFAPVTSKEINARLNFICEKEGFSNYKDTCDLISKTCNGSVRESITTLETCADFSTDLSLKNAQNIIGDLSYETMFNLTCAILNKDEALILKILEDKNNSAVDLRLFVDQYLSFCLDLSKYCLFKSTVLTNIPEYLSQRCEGFSKIPNALSYSNKLVDEMLELKSLIKYDINYKNTVLAYFIKIISK